MKKLFLIILTCLFIFGLFQCETFAAKKKAKTTRIVEVQTRDDVILSAKLTIPESASPENKLPIVILLHSLGSNKMAYDELIEKLKINNIASVAIDVRGHGKSTTKLNGQKTYWQNYSNAVYLKYSNDIIDLIKFLKENYVSLDSEKIGVIGADISASATVLAATKDSNLIKTIALISPSLNFKGLDISSSLMNYDKPVLIIVSKNDKSRYRDSQILIKYPVGKVVLLPSELGGTGDSILKVNPQINDELIKWFNENL